MADHPGDKSKQPPECEPRFTPFPPGHPQFWDPFGTGMSRMGTWSQCPNLKEVGGGMDGEWWQCDVCGKRYYLDYEDMK